VMHVMPVNDLVAHDTDPDCICDPRLTLDGIWVHHSLDGRERNET